MPSPDRYLVAQHLQKTQSLLKIPLDRVLVRAGLPADYIETEKRGLTAAEYFGLWDAAAAEYQPGNFGVDLGTTMARGPFVSIGFAFSCSPTVEVGIRRMAELKMNESPIRMTITRRDAGLHVAFDTTESDVRMSPNSFQLKLTYLLESSRLFTGEHIVPTAVTGRIDSKGWDSFDAFTGVTSTPGPEFAMTLSHEDAARPLMTRNDAMWDSFGAHLQRQATGQSRTLRMSVRVRDILLEGLPAGQSSVECVCDRLHVTRRTLQRKLKEEGVSFQELLDETRRDLSEHYINNTELSVPEISYLLGYREPRSFFRAFRNWTGRTPMDARDTARRQALG